MTMQHSAYIRNVLDKITVVETNTLNLQISTASVITLIKRFMVMYWKSNLKKKKDFTNLWCTSNQFYKLLLFY